MHMHTFNSPASAAAIVVFSNLFRVAWTGNNISVSKGALKFRCASKLCFANFSVKFWLKRWEIVVHGLTNMKNFRVSKTTYLSIRFHRTRIPLSFIGSHDRWTYVTCCITTPNNYCFHIRTRKSGAKSILFVRDLFCMRKLLLEHNDDIRNIESKVQNIWIYNKP